MSILGSEDETEYTQILRKCAESGSTDKIANRYVWQAYLAHKDLLEFARKHGGPIDILCGTGSDQFFKEDIITGIEGCADNRSPVQLLVWNDETDRIATGLRRLAADEKIHIRLSGTRDLGEKLPHVMLAGKQAYRLEAPHPYIGPNVSFTHKGPKVSALICFNDAKEVSELREDFFNPLWKVSSDITV